MLKVVLTHLGVNIKKVKKAVEKHQLNKVEKCVKTLDTGCLLISHYLIMTWYYYYGNTIISYYYYGNTSTGIRTTCS